MARQSRSFWRLFTDRGVLAVLGVAGMLLTGVIVPAAAQGLFQFFEGPPQRPQRGGGGGGGGGTGWGGGGFFGGNDIFAPFPQQRRPVVREDFSRAPAPEKRDAANPPERSVVVLGDAMGDWLGYGLEDAYAEQPDIGVIRRHKTVSGLIRYQPKGDPADWPAAAKGILAQEQPAAIVIMLGLHDRVALREPAAKPDKINPEKKPAADAAKPDTTPADDADIADPASIIAPEKSARSAGGAIEFRDDRWVELYSKKIEEMIAVAKAKGVPVLWVGLPAVRGVKATSDMLFLNAMYRDASQKAGITYVDVWDGFVDEAGRFMQQGPDFEGQTRRLRAYDGIYFTRAGARKLAHYVEREISRLLATRSAPMALPAEPEKPEVEAKPGGPAARPLVGPVVPLVAASIASDQLLGGPGSRPVPVDALAARALVRGEPLAAPAGRADDGVWPRREVGREQARGDVPVAAAIPGVGVQGVTPTAALLAPADAPKKRRPRPVQMAQPQPGGFGDFFGQDRQDRRRTAPMQAPSLFGGGFSGLFR